MMRPTRSLLSLGRIENIGARFERARIDAHERKLADVLVGHDLEDERRERVLVIGLALDLSPFLSTPSTAAMSSGDGR